MKIFQVYNESRAPFGGDFAVLNITMELLTQNGHELRLLMKSSKVLDDSIIKRMNAFWGGVYNIRSFHEMRRLLEDDRPDLVHVHSVYPMFSPSILVACRRSGVPVVMTVHDHKMTCPTTFHLYQGRICEVCIGSHEYRCVLKNCRNNILESSAYALRSIVARRFRLFHDNVDIFIAMTKFGKGKLLQAGFRDDQIAVIPNPASIKTTATTPSAGKYVAFAGRVNPDKGVDVLLAAAATLPDIPFKIAGDGPLLAELRARATPNVEFLGRLGSEELFEFYGGSRMVVVPSVCFEQFPMVILEAMGRGLPVVASRISGLPEIVDEDVTGNLFEPGDSGALMHELRRLWQDPQRCDQMGQAGRKKLLEQYTQDVYYRNLMEVYRTAIQRSRNGAVTTPLVHIKNAVPRSSQIDAW